MKRMLDIRELGPGLSRYSDNRFCVAEGVKPRKSVRNIIKLHAGDEYEKIPQPTAVT